MAERYLRGGAGTPGGRRGFGLANSGVAVKTKPLEPQYIIKYNDIQLNKRPCTQTNCWPSSAGFGHRASVHSSIGASHEVRGHGVTFLSVSISPVVSRRLRAKPPSSAQLLTRLWRGVAALHHAPLWWCRRAEAMRKSVRTRVVLLKQTRKWLIFISAKQSK